MECVKENIKRVEEPTQNILLYSCITLNDLSQGISEKEWLERFEKKEKYIIKKNIMEKYNLF